MSAEADLKHAVKLAYRSAREVGDANPSNRQRRRELLGLAVSARRTLRHTINVMSACPVSRRMEEQATAALPAGWVVRSSLDDAGGVRLRAQLVTAGALFVVHARSVDGLVAAVECVRLPGAVAA